MSLSPRPLIFMLILLTLTGLNFSALNNTPEVQAEEPTEVFSCEDAGVKFQFGGFRADGKVLFVIINPNLVYVKIKGFRFYFPDRDHPQINSESIEGYRLTRVQFDYEGQLIWEGNVSEGNTSTNPATFNNPVYIGDTEGAGTSVGTWLSNTTMPATSLRLTNVWLDFDDVSGSLYAFGARYWHFDNAKMFTTCEKGPTATPGGIPSHTGITPTPSSSFICDNVSIKFSSMYEDSVYFRIENKTPYLLDLISTHVTWKDLSSPYEDMYVATMSLELEIYWLGNPTTMTRNGTFPRTTTVQSSIITKDYFKIYPDYYRLVTFKFLNGPQNIKGFLLDQEIEVEAILKPVGETQMNCVVSTGNIGEATYTPTYTATPENTATSSPTSTSTATPSPTLTTATELPTTTATFTNSETPVPVLATPTNESWATQTPPFTATYTLTSSPIAPINTPLPTGIPLLLINGSFEDDLSQGWSGRNLSQDKIKCNKPDKTVAYHGNCAFRFKGSLDEKARLRQSIFVEGLPFTSNETIMLTAFAHAKGSAVSGKIKLRVKYTDNELPTTKITLNLERNESYMLLRETRTLLSGNVEKIIIQIDHSSTAGKVWIDGISLERLAGGELGLPE